MSPTLGPRFYCPACDIYGAPGPQCPQCDAEMVESMFAKLAERWPICSSCDQQRDGHCLPIVATGKPGRIEHPRGIYRPASRCPLGKWSEVATDRTVANL